MATDLLTADATTSTHCDRAPVTLGGAGQVTVVEQGTAGVAGSVDKKTAKVIRGSASRRLSSVISDYLQLTKPRIVVMILVTTVATAMLGAGGTVNLWQLMWLLTATAAVAASAGAGNQIWERVIDRRMTRTAKRPLPSGRIEPMPAIWFTALLGVAGTVALQWGFGIVPAIVGVITWLSYVLVYTPMKTRTAWNTTVGAIAGALPVLIGYTATGGSLGDAAGWLLFGILAAWQYPHFMSIAWLYRRQYAEAGFCMTTTVEPSGRSAGWQSILGSVALMICGILLCGLPGGGLAAVVASLGVICSSAPMLRASVRFAKQPSDVLARKLLRSSLLVLPALLSIVTLRLFW